MKRRRPAKEAERGYAIVGLGALLQGLLMAVNLCRQLPIRRCSTLPKNRQTDLQQGVTLIEIILVTGILAIIILASVITLGTTLEQRRVNQAIVDIVSIHTAVTKWADGGLIFYGYALQIQEPDGRIRTFRPDPRNLRRWSQVAPLLSPSVRALAENENTLVLKGANPWSKNYEIKPPLPSSNPRIPSPPPTAWTLIVHEVPLTASDMLVAQLRNGDISGYVSSHRTGDPSADVEIFYNGTLP